jgi:hypothetical protein
MSHTAASLHSKNRLQTAVWEPTDNQRVPGTAPPNVSRCGRGLGATLDITYQWQTVNTGYQANFRAG